MADICKCIGEAALDGELVLCPEREGCYRYTAPDGGRQSYGNFLNPGIDCEYYMEVKIND